MAKQLGEVCAGASDCDSNACADGVCCDRACTAGCERCNATDSLGTCVVRGGADKCGVQCVDGDLYRALTCDGTSPDCVAIGDNLTCGGAGCRVLPSGKSICAQCSETVACLGADESCVDGSCVRKTTQPPSVCQQDADCGRADLACLGGACTTRPASSFASIEPLPLDESCGCRLPGATGELGALSPGLFAAFCVGLALLRRRTTRRVRAFVVGGAALALGTVTLGVSACSPQEDLPANQACIDTPIALSAVVLACTDDYDAARQIANGFEGKFRCNATDVNDTPRYYRCPADVRALPCADVRAAGQDYEAFLGRSNACRLLFSRPDGSAIPPLTPSSAAGGAGGSDGAAGGAAGSAAAEQAGAAGSTP